MGYLRFILGYVVLALGAVPIIVSLIPLLPFRVSAFAVLAMGRLVSYAVLACIGVRVRFEGLDPRSLQPAIFVANHTSTLDIFFVRRERAGW